MFQIKFLSLIFSLILLISINNIPSINSYSPSRYHSYHRSLSKPSDQRSSTAKQTLSSAQSQSTSSSSESSYSKQNIIDKTRRFQGKMKGYNKNFYDNRSRQLDTVLLIVRNQTKSRVAFTLTDVRKLSAYTYCYPCTSAY